MGFGTARAGLADALRARQFASWPREDAHRKNWLAYDRISCEAVVQMLLRCNGTQHRESAHDHDSSQRVHEFFPDWEGRRWYVKAFHDDDACQWVLVSVHPSGE